MNRLITAYILNRSQDAAPTAAQVYLAIAGSEIEMCSRVSLMAAFGVGAAAPGAPTGAYLVAEGTEVRILSGFAEVAEFKASQMPCDLLFAQLSVPWIHTPDADDRIACLTWIFQNALARVRSRADIMALVTEPEYVEVKAVGGPGYLNLAAAMRNKLKEFQKEGET